MDRRRTFRTSASSLAQLLGGRVYRAGIVAALAVACVWPPSSSSSKEAFASIPQEIVDVLKNLGIGHAEFVVVALPDGDILTYASTQAAGGPPFNRLTDPGKTVEVRAPASSGVNIGPAEPAELLIIKFASPGNGIWCDRNGNCTPH
jgi:hypothetical protein